MISTRRSSSKVTLIKMAFTRTETHRGAKDAAASFLFGNLAAIAHFSHAAVHLLRSVGIASRVAVGYAADLRTRGEGSALILMANTAHADQRFILRASVGFPLIFTRNNRTKCHRICSTLPREHSYDMARNDVLDEERRDRMKKTVRTSIGDLLTRASWLFCAILLGLYL